MTLGLMQTSPLLISSILRYAAKAHPKRQIVSRLVSEPTWRYNYSELEERAARAAGALLRLGMKSGDRVSTLAWNTHRHLELMYAVPGCGAVLHTANPRFSREQLSYTINHAESSILLFDQNLLPQVQSLAPQLKSVRAYVMLSSPAVHDIGRANALCYEELLSAGANRCEWPDLDENTGAILCYTSGTTGDPKGVLYSHRAIVLHAMGAALNAAFGLTAFDVVMPCSSLYHATAWGLPFTAPLSGAKFVLPADRMDGASLHDLIEDEGVTFTGGVPTIWTSYLTYLESTARKPSKLRRIVIGGSAVPRTMAEKFSRSYGVEVLQIWGMTETCPLGVVSSPSPALTESSGADQMREVIWSRQGRLQFGIELKVVDDKGTECPWDGNTHGSLMVRGPWVVQRYFRAEADVVDKDGWFNTGDIATIDSNGFMRITDRTKDVIKSGGEWISSVDLENIATGCPGVRVTAAVGVAHPKWEERPILLIESHEGAYITKEAIREYMAPHIPRWWMPDDIIFAPIPLTATGKIDKKALRRTYEYHLLNVEFSGGRS